MLKKIMLFTFIVLGLMAPKPAWATPLSLWASSSDSSTNSRSSTLFELDSTTGAVRSSIPGPGDNADALSFTNDGNFIWVLDSSFDNQDDSWVYRVDLAGNVVQRLYVHLNAEGLTVLQDSTLVIGAPSIFDYPSGEIAFVDPRTGRINSSFSVQNAVVGLASNGVDRIYGLQWDGIIDTYDLFGNLLGSLTTGVLDGRGLAFTGEFFYVSGGPTIFQVNSAGTVVNSFAAPGGFTEGLDFPSQLNPIPEPGTWLLFGTGLMGVLRQYRRKHQRAV
jgi:hypothetical protein